MKSSAATAQVERAIAQSAWVISETSVKDAMLNKLVVVLGAILFLVIWLIIQLNVPQISEYEGLTTYFFGVYLVQAIIVLFSASSAMLRFHKLRKKPVIEIDKEGVLTYLCQDRLENENLIKVFNENGTVSLLYRQEEAKGHGLMLSVRLELFHDEDQATLADALGALPQRDENSVTLDERRREFKHPKMIEVLPEATRDYDKALWFMAAMPVLLPVMCVLTVLMILIPAFGEALAVGAGLAAAGAYLALPLGIFLGTLVILIWLIKTIWYAV